VRALLTATPHEHALSAAYRRWYLRNRFSMVNVTRACGIGGALGIALMLAGLVSGRALAQITTPTTASNAKAASSLPPPPSRGRVTDQECKEAAGRQPIREATTLDMLVNASTALTRARCQTQRTFDTSRKSLQSKPRLLALFDQTQLTWHDYAVAQDLEQFPDQQNPHATYGSNYLLCAVAQGESDTKERNKQVPASLACRSTIKTSAKRLQSLADAQNLRKTLLARIKEHYAAEPQFLAALKAGQAAATEHENAQVALAAELAGGAEGDCAAQARLRAVTERIARLREWLDPGALNDSCSGSKGRGLSFNPSEQQALVKEATKRATTGRDVAKRVRPNIERLTKALSAAEAKLDTLGQEKNALGEKAELAFEAYRTARRTTATFPQKELIAAIAAYKAALAKDGAYWKQLQLIRKTRTDLGKPLSEYEQAKAEVQRSTSNVVSASKLLEHWKNAPSAEAATKALAAVEQEQAKLDATRAPANAAESTRISNANEARWGKEYPSQSSEQSASLSRLGYEQKLNLDPKAKKQCTLESVDWKNFAYPSNWLVGDMKLKNGAGGKVENDGYEERGYMVELKTVSFVDLDRDGKQEAYAIVAVLGVGRASVSSTFVHVFDTDASCALRLLALAETCDYEPKVSAKGLQYLNCNDNTRDELTLADGKLKKIRSIKAQ
jgi:hypothetical protein